MSVSYLLDIAAKFLYDARVVSQLEKQAKGRDEATPSDTPTAR